MQPSITVSLPENIRQALDECAIQEGVAADEVVGRAIRQHLFLRRFRSLRERMRAKARSQDILTDEDIFDRVS